MIRENSPEAVALEKLIDSHGLRGVLIAVSAICYEKSAHVESNWQDSLLARQWLKAGNVVERCADNATIMRLP